MRLASLLGLFLVACQTAPADTGADDDKEEDCGDDCDHDGDGFTAAEDCQDYDKAINPDKEEVCDGRDNDCDGTIDGETSVDGETWYTDNDGDGYGDDATERLGCEGELEGVDEVNDGGDCDDNEKDASPGERESCDGIDNDCDGDTDESSATDAVKWYVDQDGDGYGDEASERESCESEAGEIDTGGDCDDANAEINPGATESCDSVDNDCDGDTDEAGAEGEITFYIDADADGHGDATISYTACSLDDTWVENSDDCNDADAAAYPGADEWCDAIDNDCDGEVDEVDAVDAGTWFADADLDGFGDDASAVLACDMPSGAVGTGGDCDDTTALAYPGAVETCDEIDNNCDSAVDEGVTTTYYADADLDGYGDAGSPSAACVLPAGSVENADDCDDGSDAINPAATESCDGVDEDCDGTIDGNTDADLDCDDGSGCTVDSCDAGACLNEMDAATCPGDTFADQADFESHTCGSYTVLSVTGDTEVHGLYVNDASIDPSYESQGLLFSTFTGTSDYPVIYRGQQAQIALADHDGLISNASSSASTSDLDGRAIRADLQGTTYAFGAWSNTGDGGYLVAYDDAGDVIDTADLAAGGFAGITSPTPIASIAVYNTFDSDIVFGVYDLQFADCID